MPAPSSLLTLRLRRGSIVCPTLVPWKKNRLRCDKSPVAEFSIPSPLSPPLHTVRLIYPAIIDLQALLLLRGAAAAARTPPTNRRRRPSAHAQSDSTATASPHAYCMPSFLVWTIAAGGRRRRRSSRLIRKRRQPRLARITPFVAADLRHGLGGEADHSGYF